MPEILGQFHFLRPAWFLVLIPTAFLLLVLYRQRFREGGLEKICDADLLPHLLLGRPGRGRRYPLALLAAAWLLTVTALAGPVWRRAPQPTFRLGGGRVVVLDLSPSMAATDITPSRLERARYKLDDILTRSREGRTGLVVFSGGPHIVVPLTDDVETIRAMLPALAVDIMPSYGDNAAPALDLAATLLRREGIKGGDILLITDGVDDLASSLDKAQTLRKAGIRLSVLGIGTSRGAPVPDPAGGGFLTDSKGAPRLSRLDSGALQELAAAGGGRYRSLTADDQDINALLGVGGRNILSNGKNTKKSIARWREEGVWLVLPILLLALAGFRRGWLLGAVLLLLAHPAPAGAMTWRDLWQRPDQQAAALLKKGEAKKAAQLFSDPAWRAYAQHKAGEYRAAAETGKNAADAVGLYNLGNSLARAGQLQQALNAYDKALKINPADQDARFNRNLIQKLLAEQKNNSRQNQGGTQKEGQKQSAGGNTPNGQAQHNSPNNDRQPQEGGKGQQPQSAKQNMGQQPQNGSPRQNDQNPSGKTEPQMSREKSGGKNPGEPEKNKAAAQQTPPAERLREQAPPQKNGADGKQGAADLPQSQTSPSSSLAGDDLKKQPTEKDLRLEQWLRQVPDDPSGLLRRKFLLEHQRRLQQGEQP